MIPGVATYHPRRTWEAWAAYTVAELRPPAQRAGMITQPVAHYTAADNLIDGDPGEHASGLPRYLAAIQDSYARSRGYSIGYLFAIDWLGGVWELRGFDYKSAANAGHNEYTAPILFLVDGADPVTAEAAASARAVWRVFRRRSNRPDFVARPLGHGDLHATTGIGTPTACPGAGITGQIRSGVLDLDHQPTLEPPTTPEDDMAKIDAIRLRLRDRNGTLYDDQVIGLTIANLGQLTQLDADDDMLITATLDADRATIEAELGFKLTPSKG